MSEFAALYLDCNQKLQLEQENVSRMKEGVTRLDSLAGTIIDTLDGLDKKLTDMEKLLLPVRDQTDLLKLKATNAEQTLRKLQSVQEHYSTLSQTDQLIDLGPASCDLSAYLDAMTRLRSAADFFGNVNPGSYHAQQAKTLYANGREKLLQYLDKILVQYAGHLTVAALSNCIDVSHISEVKQFPELMPDTSITRVADIWTWFETNSPQTQTSGQQPDYAEIVARALARSLGQLLTRLNEHLARCVSEGDLAAELTGSVSQRRSSLAIRERRSHAAYTTLPPQALQQSGSLRPSTPSGPGSANRLQPTPNAGVTTSFAALFDDPGRQSSIVSSLCAACYVLMRAHGELICRIVGLSTMKTSTTTSTAVSLLERVTRALFIHVGEASTSLCKAARRYAHHAPITSVAMLTAMQQVDSLLLALEDVKTEITFTNKAGVKQRLHLLPLPERAQKRLNDALTEIRQAACVALNALITLASAEPIPSAGNSQGETPTGTGLKSSHEMPRDGTVHETTAGVVRAIEDLLPLSKLAGQALSVSSQQQNAASTRRPSAMPPTNPNASPRSGAANSGGVTTNVLWLEYEERLRQALIVGIKRRADTYGEDASLRAVFILNNGHYIVKNLQRIDSQQQQPQLNGNTSKHMTHVRSSSNGAVAVNWSAAVDKMLRTARVTYLSSWGHLGGLVTLPPNAPSVVVISKDRDRQAIKDKFSVFNCELEQLANQHRRYTIVDTGLRNELLAAAAQEVTRPYKGFLDLYASSNFTSNRGKYIKYSEEEIDRIVGQCLTGQFSGK